MQGMWDIHGSDMVSVRCRKPGLRSFGTRVDLKKNKQNLLNIEVVFYRETTSPEPIELSPRIPVGPLYCGLYLLHRMTVTEQHHRK